jgi:hypothetical protein
VSAHAAVAAPARPRASLRDDSRVVHPRFASLIMSTGAPSAPSAAAPTVHEPHTCCDDRLSPGCAAGAASKIRGTDD